jgi:hypothetical protein
MSYLYIPKDRNHFLPQLQPPGGGCKGVSFFKHTVQILSFAEQTSQIVAMLTITAP